MADISSSRLHAQTAERRLDVMGDMANTFASREHWDDENFYAPCLGSEGPTPLIAGKVDLPNESDLDGQKVWLYNFPMAKHKTGYLVQRPDLESTEQVGDQPNNWDNWSLCTLTERRGLLWQDNDKLVSRPMDVVAYRDLRQLLGHTVFTPGITKAAIEQLGEETVHLTTFDAYFQRHLQLGRRQLRTATLAGRCAATAMYGLSAVAAMYVTTFWGVAWPLPESSDPDTLEP